MTTRPLIAFGVLFLGCTSVIPTRTLPTPTQTEAVVPAVHGVIQIELSSQHASYVFVVDRDRACVRFQNSGPSEPLYCASENSPARWQRTLTDLGATMMSSGQRLPSRSLAVQAVRAPDGSSFTTQIEPAPGTSITTLLGGAHYVSQTPPLEIAPLVFLVSDANHDERGEAVQRVAHILTEAFGPPLGALIIAPDGTTGRGWINMVEETEIGPALLVRYMETEPAPENESATNWLHGLANHLWAWLEVRRENMDKERFVARWLTAYVRLRQELNGEALRHSRDGGEVITLCARPAPDEAPVQLQARLHVSLAAMLNQRFLPDMSTCLSELGLRLAIARFEFAPAEQLLRIRALSDGLVVMASRGFFVADDQLLAVAGQAVQTREDVAWALRDVEVGARFTVRVRRNGRVLTTWANRPHSNGPIHTRFFLRPL